MTENEYADLLDSRIDRAIEVLTAEAGKAEKRIFADLIRMMSEFSLTPDGRIKPTTGNLKVMEKIRAKMMNIIAHPEWNKAVDEFSKEFRVLETITKTYLREIAGSEWNPKEPVLDAIRENAITLTRESLIESGVQSYIAKPMQEVLTRSVTVGTPFRDLVEGVRQILLEKDGRLARYAKLYAMDAQFQFSRNYIQTAAQNLGVKWWRYQGDTIRDSRDFCKARVGKFYPTDEIRSWAGLSWQGKNPNTTADNIFTLAGGYNCRHKIIPVLEKKVPEDRRKEFSE